MLCVVVRSQSHIKHCLCQLPLNTIVILRKFFRILLRLTIIFLTAFLCCADPADIPAKDGPAVDQDTGGGH